MKLALALTTVGLVALTACGSERGSTAEDPVASQPSSTGGMPASVGPPTGEVVGVGTVLDAGGPQLCLGPVAESYPPQCEGIPMTGWDWSGLGTTFESSGDVRWGSYAVTGTYDGTTFTVTQEPVPSALYDPAAPEADPLRTRCAEPEAGWSVVDGDKVTYLDQDAVMSAAVQLPGYAGAFVDEVDLPQVELPESPLPGKPDKNAAPTVINVLVTEDVEGAEQALREVWDGPLCVSLAEHTEQELIGIQDGLAELPGLLSSGAQLDQVTADVVWDDGTLQQWADATYGEGLVRINPALRPVG